MAWPYRFTSPDAEQLAQRRISLDSYANAAQYSAIILILSIKLFAILHSYLDASRHSTRDEVKQRWEHDKGLQAESTSEKLIQSFLDFTRKSSWWLDDEIIEGWGTRREAVLASIWATWLAFLAVNGTGDDYLHLTKRLAIVAASQLPIHYLLSAKSIYNPVQILTRRSHEELNPYHRLLGRILIMFFAAHASLYLNFYIQANLLSKRIRDRDVQLGLAAITSFLIIGTTALSFVRTYSYRVFYIIHITLSTAILPILYFHVVHIRVYIIQTAAIHILLTLIGRYLIDQRYTTLADISRIPNTSLLSIALHSSSRAFHNHILEPGQHIYISRPFLTKPAPFTFSYMNPFSIVNLPMDTAPQIHLLVRSLSGTTKALAEAAESKFSGPYHITVERSYGSSAYFPQLLPYDRILLVAGGVGATFTLPIYRHLLGQISQSQKCRDRPAAMAGEKIRFVWSVRDVSEAWFGINAIRHQCRHLPSGFSLHVTGKADRAKIPHSLRTDSLWHSDWEVMNAGWNAGIPSVLPEVQTGLQDESYKDWAGKGEDDEDISQMIKYGRVDVKEMVDGVFGEEGVESVAVLVCGPAVLGRELRRCVSAYVRDGKEVFWHEEQFGW